MLIESKIRRKNGTHVTMGEESYHFAPDATGRHVADVKDPDHIARLLSITEGYASAEAKRGRGKKAADPDEGGEGQTDSQTDNQNDGGEGQEGAGDPDNQAKTEGE